MDNHARRSAVLTLPNLLTLSRMAGSLALGLCVPLSPAFYGLYTTCGLTDILDGFLARRLHQTSQLGARLDSAADLLFYGIMLVRLFPILYAAVPHWVWLYVALVLLVRVMSYGAAAWKYHRFASLHTMLNKLTGLCLFFVPYALAMPGFLWYALLVCTVGLCASGQELLSHLSGTSYPAGI